MKLDAAFKSSCFYTVALHFFFNNPGISLFTKLVNLPTGVSNHNSSTPHEIQGAVNAM